MFDIGFLELVIVAIIALLVLGPERLPSAARTAGRWVGKVRRTVGNFSREIERQIEVEELREQLKQSGQSLDIDEDVKNIQKTLKDALDEVELKEYEPLPRQEASSSNIPADDKK
ncbi:MAG: Sec-independent protein translocase protein TatB [Oleiphilaceae bacterium]|nr:Sec-independent protein translocase protein TatB [Oleiphilaceae bacterium]